MREMKSITASINNDCITIRLAHSDSLVLIMQQNKNDRLYKCVLYSKKGILHNFLCSSQRNVTKNHWDIFLSRTKFCLLCSLSKAMHQQEKTKQLNNSNEFF